MGVLNYMLGFCKACFRGVKISFPARIDKCTVFGGNNFVGRNTVLNSCKIGRYTYLGNNCEFFYSTIGNFCSIAGDVRLIKGSHPTSRFVSTSPVFFQNETYLGKGFVDKIVFKLNKTTNKGTLLEIGNDVWIGCHVRILEGVSIGDGAIIGAGSIVTKDIPAYAIAVGVPARVIKYRFKEEQIVNLLKCKWWNWDIERIKEKAPSFNNILGFNFEN